MKIELENVKPAEIEKRSFEIITEELGDTHLIPGTEPIVKRCIHTSADFDYAKRSTERTTRWAKRCLETHTREDQSMFGIVQGGMYPELRRMSVQQLTELDFAGYGIGGP